MIFVAVVVVGVVKLSIPVEGFHFITHCLQNSSPSGQPKRDSAAQLGFSDRYSRSWRDSGTGRSRVRIVLVSTCPACNQRKLAR